MRGDVPGEGWNATGEGWSVPATQFAPPMISGMVLWLRADQGITLGTGSQVATWADQSGHGNNVTQATATARPTLSASGGPMGQPCLNFASASLQMLDRASAVVSASPWSAFVVQETSTPASEGFSFYVGGLSSSNGLGFGLNGSDRVIWYSGASILVDGVCPTSTWELWSAVNTGTTTTFSVNGSSQSVTNPTVQPIAPSAATGIGGSTDTAADTWNGSIAEVILYNRALTAPEVALLNSYFSTRYGV